MAHMRLRLPSRAAFGWAVIGLCVALWPGVGPERATQAQTPAPADLQRSLQKRYAAIKDFRAEFTQSAKGGVLRTVVNEQRGEVKIKKPGRMRWTYGPPDRHIFVADGTRIYFYNPADRTGHTSPIPTGDNLSAPALFLTGRGDLERDFTATMPATQPAGEWHLVLTPRRRQDDFKTLTVIVDRTSLAYRGFAWTDHQGAAHTIRFSNLRENVGLSDKEFEYSFPRGTHITTSGGGL